MKLFNAKFGKGTFSTTLETHVSEKWTKGSLRYVFCLGPQSSPVLRQGLQRVSISGRSPGGVIAAKKSYLAGATKPEAEASLRTADVATACIGRELLHRLKAAAAAVARKHDEASVCDALVLAMCGLYDKPADDDEEVVAAVRRFDLPRDATRDMARPGGPPHQVAGERFG